MSNRLVGMLIVYPYEFNFHLFVLFISCSEAEFAHIYTWSSNSTIEPGQFYVIHLFPLENFSNPFRDF